MGKRKSLTRELSKDLILTLLVLSPAILYAVALVMMMIKMRFFKDKCPKCQQRGLVQINAILATCVDEKGMRYPNSWEFCKCDSCNAKLKIFHDGRIEEPTDEEWSRNCKG